MDGLEERLRQAEAADDYGAIAACLAALAELAPEAGARAALLVRRARIAEEVLGDVFAATDDWRRVLDADPQHADATRELRRLYAATGRWDELATLLEQAADLAESPAERRALAAELAAVLRDQLGDAERAAEWAARAAGE